jgi:hypothetical protein
VYIAPQTREEDATSMDAAMAMRDEFAHESPAVRALFDALVELLTGGERKHYIDRLRCDQLLPGISCLNNTSQCSGILLTLVFIIVIEDHLRQLSWKVRYLPCKVLKFRVAVVVVETLR